jgi:putative heme-binding domain-containing protein
MNRTFLVLLFAVAAGAQDPPETRNPHTSAADIEAGAKTFRSHCSACHGMKGEGGRGPNLASGQFFHGSSDFDLLTNISEGIGGTDMPGLFYSSDRVWQVVAFIRSLNAAEAAGPGGDTAAGARVFRTSGCANCHRIAGTGGRLGPDLSNIGQIRSADYLRQSIVDPAAYVDLRYRAITGKDRSGRTFEGFLMNEDTYTIQLLGFDQRLRTLSKSDLTQYKEEQSSRMPSYREKLTDEQLRNVVAYLSSLRLSRGEQ